MDNSYSYEPPILPSIHRCRWCNKKLSEVPKQDIVCETVFMSNDGVVHWYCNKECARLAYHAPETEEMDELNRYIKRGADEEKSQLLPFIVDRYALFDAIALFDTGDKKKLEYHILKFDNEDGSIKVYWSTFCDGNPHEATYANKQEFEKNWEIIEDAN